MASKIHSYYATLSGDIKKRYDEKIKKCGGIDPYIINPNELSQNPKDFPSICMKDIENYMIHAISPFTSHFYNNFKGAEAYSFFESGFVLFIGSKRQENLAIITGKVKHSQRMNEPPLQVWILSNMNGQIICAHCTCIAGLSETCSHVGAVCFAVKNVAEAAESIKSVTDVLCKWNVPKARGVPMSAATEINWRIPTYEQSKLEASFLEYCSSISPLSDEKIDEFIEQCHKDGDVTALETILFPSKIRRKTNLRDEIFLGSLYKCDRQNMTLSELVEIGKSFSLNLTNDEVEEISSRTLPRLKSNVSMALRRGRITGSNFRLCCATDINDPFLAIRRVVYLNNLNDPISIKYKKKTMQQYVRKMELEHEHFSCEECGLKINPNLPYFAGLPDGIVNCSCHGSGCIKAQYLKSLVSDDSLESMTIQPNNLFCKDGDRYALEETHELFYHAQLLINVIDLGYCDLIIWSPQKAIVMRVNADQQFWTAAVEKALIIHQEIIMPELLGKYYTKKNGSKVPVKQNDYLENDHLNSAISMLELDEDLDYEGTLVGLDIEVLDEDQDDEGILIGLDVEIVMTK